MLWCCWVIQPQPGVTPKQGLLALAFALFPSAQAAPDAKVELCHQDGAGRFNLISVSASAVDAHLDNHGDVLAGAWYPDGDGDGFGDPDGAAQRCPTDGTTLDASDCDDADNAINPDAVEVCDDGLDNDCDLEIDEECAVVCPCAGGELWDLALSSGLGKHVSCDTDKASSDWLDLDWGLGVIEGRLVGDGTSFCTASLVYEVYETETHYGTRAEIEACAYDIATWIEAHGRTCAY